MLFNVTYFVAVGHNSRRLVQSEASLLEVEGEAGGMKGKSESEIAQSCLTLR